MIEHSLVADGILLAILISGIPLCVIMGVGILSSILQAATQIQEQTLSYVPKVGALTLVLWYLAPWFGSSLKEYFTRALQYAASGGY